MKKHVLKKLNLSRETIQPLQPQELEAINGGITPAAIVISSAVGISLFFCNPQQAR